MLALSLDTCHREAVWSVSDLATNVPGHVRVPVAARRTGLSIRTLYERIDAGVLAARRDAHGMVVVPEDALDSLDACE